MRKAVMVALAAAVLIIGAVALITGLVNALAGNRQAIAEVRADAARLQTQRDSLLAEVRDRERRQAALTLERNSHEALATRLRDSVTALERRRADAQLTVRRIRTAGVLLDRLRATFPELGDSAWGLTRLPLEPGDTLGLEYLLVPAWFVETFIIDHANAASWRAQKHRLLAVDSLWLVVTALQDSVTRLVAANAAAYHTGYQAAHAGYEDLSRRYVAELRRPRIPLRSAALGLLGAAAAGAVIARTLP